ncbi:terpene synthase family protein [Phytohabitans flavus]|uniref:terpene synthase family protein n=1 Tax=Phytohabitans flavus TaxID=1076124 RepID=UPI001E583A55|nr:terpene synthase family protein [Phytohabitans flavus]
MAGQTQREMRRWAEAYPGLFAAKPFDDALYSTLALAMAFSGPTLDSGQQRMANRATLWCFALDWQVDYVASSAEEAAAIARRCMAAAGGADPDPDDELTAFLAEVRDELAGADAYPVLGPVWREELRRMLDAMVREHQWKAAGVARPSFEEYLDNADNLGFSFVFVAHWIHTSQPPSAVDIDDVRLASWAVQRVIRLLNDLATYDRDVKWGDLNALMLGPDRTAVGQHVRVLADEARRLIAPLRDRQPALADYLERQMEFCVGFYGVTDYWGAL